MRSVIITCGATDEPIDEVMKITNMSTGKLGVICAHYFLRQDYNVTMVCNKNVLNRNFMVETKRGKFNVNTSCLSEEYPHKFSIFGIENTEEMLSTLKVMAGFNSKPDMIIHSAAVANYKPEFTFLMEDMAEEISKEILEHYEAMEREFPATNIKEIILNILTNPKCKLNSDSKISSYQSNLTVKLGLTPKIIASLRELFPETKLVGFKLLENVSESELIEVATKLCAKNNMDLVIANDLAVLRDGKRTSHFVERSGYAGAVAESNFEIAERLYRFAEEGVV